MNRIVCRLGMAAAISLGGVLQPAEAGRGHCHGGGSSAAVAFAVGAVAGLLASPPPPPPRHHHFHHYHDHGPRVYHHYPPPFVQRDIYYGNPPPVVHNTPAATANVAPAQPRQQTAQSQRRQNPFQPQKQRQKPQPGTIVEHLPVDAMSETRNGVAYFASEGIYYLPIQVGQDHRFVVVQPR